MVAAEAVAGAVAGAGASVGEAVSGLASQFRREDDGSGDIDGKRQPGVLRACKERC